MDNWLHTSIVFVEFFNLPVHKADQSKALRILDDHCTGFIDKSVSRRYRK